VNNCCNILSDLTFQRNTNLPVGGVTDETCNNEAAAVQNSIVSDIEKLNYNNDASVTPKEVANSKT